MVRRIGCAFKVMLGVGLVLEPPPFSGVAAYRAMDLDIYCKWKTGACEQVGEAHNTKEEEEEEERVARAALGT
ncbi:MAG TPA: hypothetical protein EYP31_01745, partial [Roseibacterium sp.]|nr:hypothetical protein [Roseibacterium sp.]